jgi:aryl-alcohol dehydrogenase-like predicted oxidoreductase
MLGRNLQVSGLGLGCMGLSANYGEPADKQDGIALIRAAFDVDPDTGQRGGLNSRPEHIRQVTDIGFVPWSPLGQGFLTGRSTRP